MFLWEYSPWPFLFLTVVLGGTAAFVTGRAVARRWQPMRQAVFYMVLLAAAIRFLHYALFGGTLLSFHYFLVDLAVLLVIALIGYRLTRVRQMVTQYHWLYRRRGPFAWRPVAVHEPGPEA